MMKLMKRCSIPCNAIELDVPPMNKGLENRGEGEEDEESEEEDKDEGNVKRTKLRNI